ncbi:hypothetical protein L208DRAFT_1341685 [Tricholoma matsutake]|nr:hypothetical protein L208DRAFT_1341685 [Tricholoma matsutake 945]
MVEYRRSTLLSHIFSTNSLDLILDFVLMFVSAIFNYAGPFFLRQVLTSSHYIPHVTPRCTFLQTHP